MPHRVRAGNVDDAVGYIQQLVTKVSRGGSVARPSPRYTPLLLPLLQHCGTVESSKLFRGGAVRRRHVQWLWHSELKSRDSKHITLCDTSYRSGAGGRWSWTKTADQAGILAEIQPEL